VVAPPPPPPPVFLNTTVEPPPPAPEPDALGGFTPTCTSADSSEAPITDCPESDVEYMYFLPITKEVQLGAMKAKIDDSLIRYMWVDKQTKTLAVEFVTYNGNHELFAVVDIRFEFNLGGKVEREIEVTTLNLELDKDELFSLRHVLDFIVVMYVFMTAVGELLDVWSAFVFYGNPLKYFDSIWNVVDMAQIWVFVMCIINWYGVYEYSKSVVIGQRYDWSPDGEKHEDTGQNAQELLLEIMSSITEANEAMHACELQSIPVLLV
jgi:hypothetical protein